MRVVTYNIASCKAGIDAVASVLKAIEPDVAMLQEVARGQERALADALRMGAVKGFTRRVRGFGNALLVRDPPIETQTLTFSRTSGREPRGAVLARLRTGITVVSAHVGLSEEERLRHVTETISALEERDRVVIGADLNEGPSGIAASSLLERYTDAFGSVGIGNGHTIPAIGATARIDYILVSGLTVTRAWVDPAVGSDHLAVVAELT